MHDRLVKVFQEVFPTLTYGQVCNLRDWDSINGVSLVLAIEDAFGVQLDLSKVAQLSSFQEVYAHLAGLSPKKAIICDLDNTLWKGVHAEGDAVEINRGLWNLTGRTMRRGGLVGIVTKNDLEKLPPFNEDIFVEAGWGPKSEAIGRLLKIWNILPKDVVFVDDSPLELAEVRRAFPDIVAIQWESEEKTLPLLLPMFEKNVWKYEDVIRAKSIRAGVEFEREARSTSNYTDFLLDTRGVVRFHSGWTERAQELVQKTNQFNMNGIRRTREELEQGFLLTVEYKDRFGDLGTIGVIHGEFLQKLHAIELKTFALSCRAFSRRIEFHMLQLLFDMYGPSRIYFEYVPTGNNGVFYTFLKSIGVYSDNLSVGRYGFETAVPELVHTVNYPEHDPRSYA